MVVFSYIIIKIWLDKNSIQETRSTVSLKRRKEDDLNDESEWLQQKFRTMEKEKKAKLF